MIRTRIVKSGFKTALRHKLRAIFMVVSVMIGIAALTLIISIGKGTQKKVMSRMERFFGSNTVVLMSGSAKMEGMHPEMEPTTTLKLSQVEEVAARVGTVVSWDAVQTALDRPATYDGRNATVDVYGHMPSAVGVWNLAITEGRFFTDAENRGLSRVAVIAPNVRKELFGSEDPVGKEIEIDGIPFQVIGTVGPRGLDPHGMNQDDQVLIPLQTLLKRVANEDYVMAAKFIVPDKSSIAPTAAQVTRIMTELHHIGPGEDPDFMVATPTFVNEMLRRANAMFNVYLPVIALISLLVGSIVVINMMLLSVNERVAEIGLRKAVGARSKDILYQFLVEAFSMTITGGAVGIVVGLMLLSRITQMMHIPFIVSWSVLLACLVISSLVGILAGIIPARRAAALQPVEALR